METLSEITKKINDLEIERRELSKSFTNKDNQLNTAILKLRRLEVIALAGMDLEKIQMAEKILYWSGKPWSLCEGELLTDLACIDIANDHPHLSKRYFGNKQYESFYQRTDCEYGYGPRHGHIVDAIGMKDESRGQVLCTEEKDACIYYLKNLQSIVKIAESPLKH